MNAFSGLKEIGLFFFFSPNITYHATGYYVIFPLPEYALWVSMKEKKHSRMKREREGMQVC